MALPFKNWGSTKRSAGIFSAISKQVGLLNFGGAKKITVSFDPFGIEGVDSTRNALSYMNQQKVRATNPSCLLKTAVLSDRSNPTILVELVDGSEILLKTERLSTLEILQQLNNFVTVKAPKKEISTSSEPKTKAQKAAMKKKR